MKVIIDTNLWISFLIGHQTKFVRRMLTDLRFDVFVCSNLIEEIRDVASRDKIRKHLGTTDLDDLLNIINAFCQFATIEAEVASEAVRARRTFISLRWPILLLLIISSVVMQT